MLHIYKLPDTRNANRKDKNGKYFQVNPEKLPFDINESKPTRQYAANSISCEADLANEVRLNNHVNGSAVQFQDSFTGMLRNKFARWKRFVNAERVSSRVEVTSAGRAIKIRSQPEASVGSKGRMASRKSLLARLRSTAVPAVLPADTPTRKVSFDSFACATNTI